jgi:hypothetical protein
MGPKYHEIEEIRKMEKKGLSHTPNLYEKRGKIAFACFNATTQAIQTPAISHHLHQGRATGEEGGGGGRGNRCGGDA